MAMLLLVDQDDGGKWRQIRLRHGEERSSVAIQKTGIFKLIGYKSPIGTAK
jgi:hypothetical protein